MAENFINNLRGSTPALQREGITNSFIVDDPLGAVRQDVSAMREYVNENNKNRNRLVAETTPLRNEIKKVSDGRVIVDDSVYDKTELERILKSVKEMKDLGGGSLMPYYSIVSDGKNLSGGVAGMTETGIRRVGHSSNDPFLRFVSWYPGDHFGTQNNPYRIRIKDANDIIVSDLLASIDASRGWHPWRNEDKEAESDTHVHELGHSAQFGALKNTNSPSLTTSYEERKKRQDFRDTHPSLHEIFDIAARNTGFDNIVDAAKSISGYAEQDATREAKSGGWDNSKNWGMGDRLSEVFAEAYSDVITNKDKASPYAKEIIRLYANYVNDYKKTFNQVFTPADKGLLPKNSNNAEFINNLRELHFGKKK